METASQVDWMLGSKRKAFKTSGRVYYSGAILKKLVIFLTEVANGLGLQQAYKGRFKPLTSAWTQQGRLMSSL